MKFQNWDNPKTIYDPIKTLSAVQWLKNHEITIRGHYLLWGALMEEKRYKGKVSNNELNNTNLLRYHFSSFTEEVLTLFKEDVFEWDIINHPVTRNQKDQFRVNGKRITLQEYFGEEYYLNFLEKVKKIHPGIVSYVNESHILTRSGKKYYDYLDLVTSLKENNARLDGIGFMSHFHHRDLPSIRSIKEKLDEFSTFGFKLKITEFDVLFGEKFEHYEMSKDELDLQKQFTEDFLRICFSHPSVEGIILWGFWEGAHWYPAAALWDKDWNIKPNGQAWLDLVFKEWWTDEIHVVAQNEKIETRGFLGEYNLKIMDKLGNLVLDTNFVLPKYGIVLEF